MFKKIGIILSGVILLAVAITFFTSEIYTNSSEIETQQTVETGETSVEESTVPKNIIFLIGDGMSVTTLTAYRYFADDLDTPEIDYTAFDAYLVGQQTTYSADSEENITDSAAAATALATGVKTYNAGVAVDNDGEVLPTVLEAAKSNGKSTGIIATSEVTHATPASFGSYSSHRNNYSEIADNYIDSMINGEPKVDVLLGGGRRYFSRTDRNLISEFEDLGYDSISSKEELLHSTADRLLGLFEEDGLPKMIDRSEDVPSLKDMTETAINVLSDNEEGFFLMVEGSQIDWGGHDNDVTSMMSEMIDFEEAFEVAIDFANEDGETLVIATADHATGGFSMGVDGEYNWNPEPIRQMQRTPDYIAQQIVDTGSVEEVLEEYVEWSFDSDEIGMINDALSQTDGSSYPTIRNTISKAVDKRSYTGWTTSGHTGEDVNVYAFGPESERWHGLTDNTDFGNTIFELLEEE